MSLFAHYGSMMSPTPRERLAEIQRRTLKRMQDATGWSGARLAEEAGMAPSTINRRMQPGDQGLISIDKWELLSNASGVPVPPDLLRDAPDPTQLNIGVLESVLAFSLSEMRIRRPLDLAGMLARQIAYAYPLFIEAEREGRPISDVQTARRLLQDILAQIRAGHRPPAR